MVAQANHTNTRRRAAPKKQHIATALISVVGTIAVSLVSVLPQLRNKDSQIEGLVAQVEQFKRLVNAAGDSKEKEKESAASKRQFTGTVLDLGGKPLGHVEVFLIPTDSNLKQTTGDDGKFAFTDVPGQPYNIVVREPKNGAAFGMIREEDNSPNSLGWAKVEYHIR